MNQNWIVQFAWDEQHFNAYLYFLLCTVLLRANFAVRGPGGKWNTLCLLCKKFKTQTRIFKHILFFSSFFFSFYSSSPLFFFFGMAVISSLKVKTRVLWTYGTRMHIYFNILQIFVEFLLLQDTSGGNKRDGKMDKIVALIELKF